MRIQFSTAEASSLTGASVRQIDTWARSKLLCPSGRDAAGRGTRRRYTFQDIVALQTIRSLRANGCPLQKIRATVRYLKHHPDVSNSAVLARLILITDGKKVYTLDDT